MWWLHDPAWTHYQASASSIWALFHSNLGHAAGATVILYVPAFVADPLFNGTGLARVNAVVADAAAAGLRVLLFVGRPEYQGDGTPFDTHDVVHDPASQAYLLARVRDLLSVPAVQQSVRFVSVYWMGLSSFCQNGGCTETQIANYSQTIQATVHAALPGALHVQHVDGPFWDACWPQPCATWNFNGYSPASLTGLDALFAESWVQGSLAGGVARLLAEGVVSNGTLLLCNDVPNCDLYPTTKPCATGSLASDTEAWFAILDAQGLGSTWAVWDFADGGDADPNYYGDVLNNGTGLTPKGRLHQARAQSQGERRGSAPVS